MILFAFEDVAALMVLEQTSFAKYPDLALIAEGIAAAFENYTGRLFSIQERTVEQRPASRTMSLAATPITEVASITVEGADYDVDLIEIEESAGIRFPVNMDRQLVAVTYTGGIDPAAVPVDIKRAAILQTVYEYQGKDHVGADSVTSEGGTVHRPALQLLDHVTKLLDRHVHPWERLF